VPLTFRFPFIFIVSFYFFSFYNPVYSQPDNTFSRIDSLRGYLNSNRSCYDIIYYDLEVSIDTRIESISGSNEITLKALRDFNRIQLDLFENMIVDSIIYNMHPISYTRDGNAIIIDFNNSVVFNQEVILKVFYHGHPVVSQNPPWSGGFVWARDSLNRTWIGVECQGTGASLWWPNKDHLSDEPDSMQISIIAPEPLIAVSNGKLIENYNLPGNLKKWIWKVTYPINNYGVTINLGYYSHFNEKYLSNNSEYMLDYYVLDYNLDKAKSHFKQVRRMLESYEYYFGPYPFERDGYKLVEAPYWGMEHQSCIAYGNEYQNEEYYLFDYIIIHESGHEWWGNSVSTKDNGELWIHEAFTTYMESLFIEYDYGYNIAINYLEDQKAYIENMYPISGPLSVNFNDWDDSDMYYKGSWMLHSIRNTIGDDEEWFSTIKKTYQHFKYQTISGNELINFMNSQVDYDIEPIFRNFLTNRNIPELKVKMKKNKHGIKLTYRWKNVNNDFNMPTKVRVDKSDWVAIFPGIKNKSILLKYKDKKEVEFATDLFYHAVN